MFASYYIMLHMPDIITSDRSHTSKAQKLDDSDQDAQCAKCTQPNAQLLTLFNQCVRVNDDSCQAMRCTLYIQQRHKV